MQTEPTMPDRDDSPNGPLPKHLADAQTRVKTRPSRVSVSIQGDVCEYKVTRTYTGPIGGKRSVISEFSRSARLRMLKELHRVDYEHFILPLFVTLTYPDALAFPSKALRNQHRKLFFRKLEAALGRKVPACWRLEFQTRKSGSLIGEAVPHFHLLLFRQDFIPWETIRDCWKRAIGWTEHVATDIRRVDKAGVVDSYMAKYISKEAIPPSFIIAAYGDGTIGKAYGWIRKNSVPMYTEHARADLTDRERESMLTLASEVTPYVTGSVETSFTLIGEESQTARKICGIPLTGDGCSQ